MKLPINKYLISLVFACLVLAAPFLVLAVEFTNPITGAAGGSFENAVKNVITAALGISGVLALIAFIYGGITWMISYGDPGKIAKGKTMMIWAVWGIVIIFASYAILNFVFEALTSQ